MFAVSVVTIPAVQQRYRCGLCFTHHPRELDVTNSGYLALLEDGHLQVTLVARPEILLPPPIIDVQDSPPAVSPMATARPTSHKTSKGKR